MFNLCKTVKIYHTVNHYHVAPGPKDRTEIRFEDTPHPSGHMRDSHSDIRMIQSHSLSPRKSRAGINLSLKDSSVSPSKNSEFTHYKNDLSNTNNNRSSYNSHGQQSQISSLKFRNFHRLDRDSPKIVESKITYGEMSPRLKSKQTMEEIPSQKVVEDDLPAEIPLIKVITGTTQQSIHSDKQKMCISSNPLKKSTSFLRSSSKSRIDDSVRNSLVVDSSLNNTIDFKFSTYKPKKEDVSDSLLRLSCSSYTEILDKAQPSRVYEDFSQTCSLELKKEESCLLNDYACDVNESIILNKSGIDKKLKEVKSNYDLFRRGEEEEDISQVHSIIIGQGRDSPVQKLKKRFGDNLLHPYDRETIESKSFISRSHNESKANHVIDESYIIQHEIENKFVPLKGSEVNRQQFKMFLAVEDNVKMLVSIKQLPISCIQKVNQELNIYRQIQTHSLEVSISKLYQMYTHGNIFVIVKEPYELTLQDFIDRHSKEYVLISWQFIIKNIEQTLLKTISVLRKRNMHLSRLISAEDIVNVFGEWKLHSPEVFTLSQVEYVQDRQVLQYLRQEIMGRVRKSHNHN